MVFFYNLSIRVYVLLIGIAAFFNPKAKLWVQGRKQIFEKLRKAMHGQTNIVWFHSASLGEFEQALPVIEGFKQKYPDCKILLTFFSPSGYEARKNYEGADFVFYLPPDFRSNAKRFVELVNPKMVFFVKYEFWLHYLRELQNKNIPTYVFSAIFRPGQVFFKPWGRLHRKMLSAFTHIFVQNQESDSLLKGIGVDNVSVTGDTRFDRVHGIAKGLKKIPEAEGFGQSRPVLIAGSTWPKDETNIIRYLNHGTANYKYIIAPHEINEGHVTDILKKVQKKCVRLTQASKKEIDAAEVLVVDCIGKLSSLYRYGDVAYIGGGFGKGIHNTLEAAVFGIPVIFGPNHEKFQEAKDLTKVGAAHPYKTYKELERLLDRFYSNPDARKSSGQKSKKYIDEKRGASSRILDLVKFDAP